MADANRLAAALRYQQGMALPTPEPDSMVGRALDAAAQWGRGVQKNVSDLVSPTAWAEALKNPPRGVLSQMNPENKQEMINQGIDSALNFGPAMLGKIVYHGSPHKFDAFDMSKIGTGEGAQAYGHGLYFAENPKVAQDYAVNLSAKQGNVGGSVGNKQIANFYSALENKAAKLPPKEAAPIYNQLDLLERLGFNELPADVLNYAKESYGAASPEVAWLTKEIMPKYKGAGNLYKVDLPDEHIAKMLDWDKPLSQQTSQEMKDAFNGIIKKYPELKEKFVQAYRDKQPGNIYYSILNDYRKSGDLAKNQLFASDVLREAGIPGIRYLDQGSRTAGEGTSNFVVFDPKHMNIIGRE